MVSRRVQSVDASGIRKIFDMAATLKDPIDLSIGQPDFDAWDVVKESAKAAIDQGKNRYTPSPGIPPLREKIKAKYDPQQKHPEIDGFCHRRSERRSAVELFDAARSGG